MNLYLPIETLFHHNQRVDNNGIKNYHIPHLYENLERVS